MLQRVERVAVCCSVLRCTAAVCCNVISALKCVEVLLCVLPFRMLQCDAVSCILLPCVAVCCSVLCCNVMRCVAVRFNML